MKVIKFGGKSLANGQGIKNVLNIIEEQNDGHDKLAVVLSARGNATNELEELLDIARRGDDFTEKYLAFSTYQSALTDYDPIEKELELIYQVLQGIKLTKDYSLKVKDFMLAQGEIIAVKVVSDLLNKRNIISQPVDARDIITTDDNYGKASVKQEISKSKTINYISKFLPEVVPIITGFIGSTTTGETTTLGRNGSNYTASLIANYLDANKIISYTDVDGIYTANPTLVDNANVIQQLNYNEASELARFGAKILHPQTISPLIEKNIPIHIKNTFKTDQLGTIINGEQTPRGIKSITVQDDVALINIEGKNFVGKVGIDGRIFSTLKSNNISAGIVSQGSSERGISFIVEETDTIKAVSTLRKEFELDISKKEVNTINAISEISVITIVGQSIGDLSSALSQLKQNNIPILLINNTLSGNNIGLVLKQEFLQKAINIIHAQIMGVNKKINIAIIGKGTVGSSLINQILESKKKIENKKHIKLNIFAIAGSKKVLLNKNGISNNWQTLYDQQAPLNDIAENIVNYADENHLENLIAVDNTASSEFVTTYPSFIKNGFDLVSSNKIANTQSYESYKHLRSLIEKHKKHYLYETNVGAGLPIIDTIKLLHDSGENITKIKGVFSGSLSYLFNSFSQSDKPFSFYLKRAMELGYTEPDPREDLSGGDVARKLLILARELDLENEYRDIDIENLIPKEQRQLSLNNFLQNLSMLDEKYAEKRDSLNGNQVLRYVGELGGDLSTSKGNLQVKLITADRNSALGNLQGSDSIIEIYTESYQNNPITIIGAGAGAKVTARGVFGDILRIANQK